MKVPLLLEEGEAENHISVEGVVTVCTVLSSIQIVNLTMGLRMSAIEEELGADIVEHGVPYRWDGLPSAKTSHTEGPDPSDETEDDCAFQGPAPARAASAYGFKQRRRSSFGFTNKQVLTNGSTALMRRSSSKRRTSHDAPEDSQPPPQPPASVSYVNAGVEKIRKESLSSVQESYRTDFDGIP